MSTNVGAGSRPVHETGRTVREGSEGTLSGNSVRESVTGDVHTGPVSDISAGPVTAGRSVSGTGTMTDASVGSVKKDVNSPLGERISEPLRELGTLQQQLRELRPLARNAPAGSEDAFEELPAAGETVADTEGPVIEETEPDPASADEDPADASDDATAFDEEDRVFDRFDDTGDGLEPQQAEESEEGQEDPVQIEPGL